MKVKYSDFVGIQETTTSSDICNKCLFLSHNFKCCHNPLFDNLHPCCSFEKYYKEITESDIFNL